MARKAWTQWTHEAVKNNPTLPDVTPDDPTHTTLYSWSTRPDNWYPDNAVDRIREQPTTQARYEEYARVVYETIEKATAWEDAPDSLPPWYGTDFHVAGEMYALSSRLVKGMMSELTARDWAEENGHDVMTTREALNHGDWEDVSEMEKAEVDFVTCDGTTWQVKSSKPEQETKADRLVVVKDGEVVEG